uniref:Uncharacterized protein n=1 Tax=Cannabis sativa TaxID=3483 RepID=A0A803PCA8_CANSA
MGCPEVEVPDVNQGAESPDTESDLEKAALVRRKRYKTCIVLSNCPLSHYDANGNLLNKLGEPSVLGLDHVLNQSFEPEILNARSQGANWVSPASTLSVDAFSKILASGLVRGVVLPLHPYFRDIAAYFGMCPTQISSKSIKYLSTMFVLYTELGWPQRNPYEIGYYFDLKSTPKQNRTGYFFFSQVGHQWLGDINSTNMSKVGSLKNLKQELEQDNEGDGGAILPVAGASHQSG